ncbi:transketolase [Metamycoplasma subdolum]|uniref:Transketolase n=2 Tax=Metamycoplasma subdolum TaxID=92407 RepID=A0A3M0A0H7_9BACT|nr:transketolase [Metamycoplasma subdolum]
MKYSANIDQICIDNLKINALAMIEKANFGFSGAALSAATIMHSLFCYHLKFDLTDPTWINRDRFILSSSHGSSIYYAMQYILGLLSKKDLESFHELNSKTPAFIEKDVQRMQEIHAGLPGHGISHAVGLALAEEIMSSKFPEISHNTYVLCSDSDLQEGISQEAISFAGTQRLSKLIILYDANGVQNDAYIPYMSKSDKSKKYNAMGWNYIFCENITSKINKAIRNAKKGNRPTIIEIKTIIGEGTKVENSVFANDYIPSKEDIQEIKDRITYKRHNNFEIKDDVINFYKANLEKKIENNSWFATKKLKEFLESEIKINLNDVISQNEKSLSFLAGKIINNISSKFDQLLISTADISRETNIRGATGLLAPNNKYGRDLFFGKREQAMGAISLGIASYANLNVVLATKLIYADLIKPSIKLAKDMKLKIMFVFTHDSVFDNLEGYSKQPLYEIASLRTIKDLKILRPVDEKELKGAFELLYNKLNEPCILLLHNQAVKNLEKSDKFKFINGSYFLRKGKSDFTLISTGYDLQIASEIADDLDLNLISASNIDNLDKLNYKWDKSISLESGSTLGWKNYAKYNLGLEKTGKSGKLNELKEYFEFTKQKLIEKIKKIM